MKKCFFPFIGLIVLLANNLQAQIADPVKWNYSIEKSANNTYNLIFKAKIEDKWHLYSQDIPEGGPVATSFQFTKSSDFKTIGKVKEYSDAESKYDASFDMTIKMFVNEAIFKQTIQPLSNNAFSISGTLQFMCCDNSRCLPPKDVDFNFSIPKTPLQTTESANSIPENKVAVNEPLDAPRVKPGKKDSLPVQNIKTQIPTNNVPVKNESLWGIILLALAAGILGVFTPCVYPMIPMTVSFFMRGEDKRSKGIFNGIVFGLSIILVYTFIGAIVAITRSGESVTNFISTHWLPNSIFFLMFLIFALWFFGMFEIVLPGSLANKLDQKADKGGIAGAFFMALTLIIVSFSCTGPFVGSILVEASKGAFIKPVVGMFFYGLAFAAPFVIFAISPVLLKKMAKSGSWLNTVKVVVAFILLAFSLKYLSIIDSTLHLKILPREIFLSIWIVVFALLGFYLLGKLKFPHDNDLPYIPVPRFILAVVVFSFVVYMIPGLFGANLKEIGAYLPPASKNEFALGSNNNSGPNKTVLCGTPKYSDILELPYNLEGYFDLQEGLDCAKKSNKPVFLDFKGHACANCKKMEAQVWSDPRVQEKLAKNFIIIALYTDETAKLPESEWIISADDGKVKKTLGAKNLDYEITKFKTNTQPLYAILAQDGNPISAPMGMNIDVDAFLKFLDEGIKGFSVK
jgi:thiol:disulfide interchange protein